MRANRCTVSAISRLCLSFVLIGTAGCGGSSSDQSLQKGLSQAGMTRDDVFPLAGTVTIDGQPPSGDEAVVVMLNDPTAANVPLSDRRYAQCDSEGKFSFTTYTRDDGVPGRKYIITIAQLHKAGEELLGPDKLGNRYNDPDRNADKPEFTIDHKKPGKKDYVFDLKFAGEEPGTPGPHSLTQLR